MEVNREEATRCLELAMRARRDGDITKATRLAQKSIKLFPTRRAENFLEEISQSGESPPHNSTPTNQPTQDNNPPVDPEVTAEINRILGCKNLYDILSIPHDASQADIKKQYRKYALKFHPDKCTAPRATDAFKSIGRSFSVLSDPDKRRKYDLVGDENDLGNHGYRQGDVFGEELDPFDLFASMFMGGELGGGFMRSGRVYRNVRVNPRNGQRVFINRQHHHHHHNGNQQDQQEFNLGNLLPVLPLLLLLLWSIFGNILYPSNSPYSFEKTRYYSVQRQLGNTNNYLYYVPVDFEKEYNTQSKVNQLENSVLSDLLYHYGVRCQHDVEMKRQQVYFARLRRDTEAMRNAENMNTPGCASQKDLQQIRASRG